MDTGRRGGDWKPVKPVLKLAKKAQKEGKKTTQVADDVRTIMSTFVSKKSEVDIISPPTTTRAGGKRGPKRRALPEDLIRQLADEGMGSKAIATRLRVESSVEVSYKTIQRLVKGERKLL